MYSLNIPKIKKVYFSIALSKRFVVNTFTIAALLILFSSCRDKGAYTYSGIVLDSCAVKPVANATVNIYAGESGTRTVKTNQAGYFKVSGTWNESITFLYKEVVPSLTVRSNDGEYLFEADYLPQGNHSFGTIASNHVLKIPYRIDTTNNSEGYLSLSFRLLQPDWVLHNVFPSYPEFVDETSPLSGTIHYRLPLCVDATQQQPAYPVVLQYSTPDSSYMEQDVTDLIKLCQISDTVVVKL
jgi:hypothetical protein